MRKRNHVIPVRLNAKELRFLEEQVEKSGLSREEYIRSIVMGGEVRARPCEHHIKVQADKLEIIRCRDNTTDSVRTLQISVLAV